MADHPPVLAEEIAVERDLCALPDPEQLELIRDAVPGRDAGTAVAIMERRGRGRPPGARNARNAKFRDQILRLGPHPALALQRCYSTPVDALAATLGCSKVEAFQLQLRAASELLPYIEGKQPVQIDIRQQHDVVMIMAGAPGVGGAELDAIARDVNEQGEGIDWGSMEIVPQLGEPERDAPPGDAT